MDGQEFRNLARHMEWADAKTWQSVRDLPAAQSDERLRYLLHHIHIVQEVYLQAWRGDPFAVTQLEEYPDLLALDAWARPYYPRLADFAATVDESAFATPVDFPWAEMIKEQFGGVAPATLAESAWQVFSHTSYHRGQVAARVREIGGVPPTVDFLVWVWSGRPAPEWN
jgi:uncharacterized damage-inducible protein DinB